MDRKHQPAPDFDRRFRIIHGTSDLFVVQFSLHYKLKSFLFSCQGFAPEKSKDVTQYGKSLSLPEEAFFFFCTFKAAVIQTQIVDNQ
jgi:hypothetical protein